MHRVQARGYIFRHRQQLLSRIAQHDAATVPIKDRAPQDGLETFDLKTCSRLRPVDAGRTVRNATGLGYGNEGP